MADMPAAPMPAEPTPAEQPMAGDFSQGYCVEISVLPDGTFKVSGPEPLKEQAEADAGDEPYSEMGQDYTSVGAALKGILEILKANPVGADDQKQFDAGFDA